MTRQELLAKIQRIRWKVVAFALSLDDINLRVRCQEIEQDLYELTHGDARHMRDLIEDCIAKDEQRRERIAMEVCWHYFLDSVPFYYIDSLR